jgi:MFS transporter, putative metabolite:H+ symporter
VTPGATTIQRAIDEIGYGRFQRRMLAICGVTWAADAAEVLFIGFALPAIRAEFGLDDPTSGLLATVTFVGMLLGAWFWGAVADRIGRRLGFMTTPRTRCGLDKAAARFGSFSVRSLSIAARMRCSRGVAT